MEIGTKLYVQLSNITTYLQLHYIYLHAMDYVSVIGRILYICC